MKKSAITQEVMGLAKKIAEHWRMEIYEGCWVILRWQRPFLMGEEYSIEWATEQKAIPIPSISDCLEKLRELGYTMLIEFYVDNWWSVELFVADGVVDEKRGDALHEVLLSALLEVVKMTKNPS